MFIAWLSSSSLSQCPSLSRGHDTRHRSSSLSQCPSLSRGHDTRHRSSSLSQCPSMSRGHDTRHRSSSLSQCPSMSRGHDTRHRSSSLSQCPSLSRGLPHTCHAVWERQLLVQVIALCGTFLTQTPLTSLSSSTHPHHSQFTLEAYIKISLPQHFPWSFGSFN